MCVSIIEKIKYHGVVGSLQHGVSLLERKIGYHKWRCRNAPIYANPTPEELAMIEQDLRALDIVIDNYTPRPAAFKKFQAEQWFPLNYHGGQHSGVWDEKLLEHWLASERLGLMNYGKENIFVDIAAGGSPWAKILRDRKDI
jgi:hypothetical protein